MELDVTILVFSEGSMKLQGEKAEVHEALVAIGQKRMRIESAEARWVIRAVELKLHLDMGMGSMADYFEQVMSWSSAMARERVRTSLNLIGLPGLRADVEAGRMLWTAVREV